MSTRTRHHLPGAVMLLTLACPWPALAQRVTTLPDLTAQQVIGCAGQPGPGSAPMGEAIALATAVEIGTAPFGTSSGGFVFKLDPATGLLARTTTTFGPSFAERALTSGEGKVSIGATFRSTSTQQLSDFSLATSASQLRTAAIAAVARTRTANRTHVEDAGDVRHVSVSPTTSTSVSWFR